MALSGYKEFSTGEVLTAANVNDYLMQVVMVFADATARDSGIAGGKRQEGQFYFLKNTNELGFYDGSNFVAFIGDGDISSVVAGTNISGGGTSGAVTLNLAIDAAVAFADQTASAIVLKDYAETDVAVSSATTLAINLANGNTGAVTLGHNVTDIDFTNVPTNGVSTFTLKATQDGTGSRTMAINAVTVNAGSHATAKTAGAAGLTLSTGAADVDLITFLFFDAATPLLNAQLDFS
jgi:hypothetical protein|tara:strand:+ start:249 stop:956 length:708 start_codon:yes stop_codon:yes gene_type:complete